MGRHYTELLYSYLKIPLLKPNNLKPRVGRGEILGVQSSNGWWLYSRRWLSSVSLDVNIILTAASLEVVSGH